MRNRFDSCRSHHFWICSVMVTQRTFNPSIVGSSPVRSTIYGCVAQLAEQLTLNHQVAGSMPVAPTKGSSKTETDLIRLSRIQTDLAWCVTWSMMQNKVQFLCSPPLIRLCGKVGLIRLPVTQEIAGSSPVRVARP